MSGVLFKCYVKGLITMLIGNLYNLMLKKLFSHKWNYLIFSK
jgi:hypothetical protein